MVTHLASSCNESRRVVYHEEKADSRWSSGPLVISNAIATMTVSSAALSLLRIPHPPRQASIRLDNPSHIRW